MLHQKTFNEAEVACILGNAAVDEKTGIISSCVEMMVESYDPKLFFFTTNMADTSMYKGYNKCHPDNGGAGLTREQAKAAAIGESIERYCSSVYNKEDLVFASYTELKPNAVPPSDWILFSDRQYAKKGFPFKPFTENTKIFWVEGQSLITNKTVYVPANFVYLPFYVSDEQEAPIAPSVSTGLSAGITYESAILGGIYEVVERDAITNMWLNNLSLSTIDEYSNNTGVGKIIKERIMIDNAKYNIIEITNDIGIPVVFCVKLFQSSKGPAAACGAAARLNGQDAVLKAVLEASQGAKWIQYLHMEDWAWGYNDDFSDINQFKDHVRLYSLEENLEKLQFVYSDKTKKQIDSLEDYSVGNKDQDIRKCLEFLEKKRFDVIVVDITSDDIKNIGFKVVKVLIPGTLPLNGDHNYPFLGGNRLYNLPSIMKYSTEKYSMDTVNKNPHPFP